MDAHCQSGRDVLQLDSTFQLGIVDLARVLVEQGKANEAVSMLLPILEVSGLSHLENVGVVAYALARAGRTKRDLGCEKSSLDLPGVSRNAGWWRRRWTRWVSAKRQQP